MGTTQDDRYVWTRGLPGGGFAAIQVRAERSLFRATEYHGALIVERRAEIRRAGHQPPIVAEAHGPTVEAVVEQLLPTAESNPALGAAILRREQAALHGGTTAILPRSNPLQRIRI